MKKLLVSVFGVLLVLSGSPALAQYGLGGFGGGGNIPTALPPSGAAGGDLGGTYPNPTVISVANITTGTLAVSHGGTGITSFGTGVATALGVAVGSAGAPVLYNGAGGTPSSLTLTSATGLPVSTGITGLGTGVATALGVAVGSAGGPVVNGGAIGAATGTSLALGGATLGANVLAVTGTVLVSSNLTITSGTVTSTSFQAAAAGQYYWSGRAMMDSTANGVVVIGSNTHATGSDSRICFQGAAATEACLKRAGGATLLEAVLGNDSGRAPFAAQVLRTDGFTVALLPASPGTGARAYVTDQLTTCASVGVALTGGGAVVCPVFYNGSAWVGG